MNFDSIVTEIRDKIIEDFYVYLDPYYYHLIESYIETIEHLIKDFPNIDEKWNYGYGFMSKRNRLTEITDFIFEKQKYIKEHQIEYHESEIQKSLIQFLKKIMDRFHEHRNNIFDILDDYGSLEKHTN